MKKINLVLLVILIFCLLIPLTAAELLEDYQIRDIVIRDTRPSGDGTIWPHNIDFYAIEEWTDLTNLDIFFNTTLKAYPMTNSSSVPVNFTYGDRVIGYGTAGHEMFSSGSSYKGHIWIEIDEWDVSGLSGTKRIEMKSIYPIEPYNRLFGGIAFGVTSDFYADANHPVGIIADSKNYITGSTTWKNNVEIMDNKFILSRNVDDYNYYSSLKIVYLDDYNYIVNNGSGDFEFTLRPSPVFNWTVIASTGRVFTGVYGVLPTPPIPIWDNKTFTVFVKDGNTYEPIPISEMAFKRYDTGEWILNKTIYDGYSSITLPAGWYYVYVTSPGYYQLSPTQMVVDENLVSSTFRIYPAGEVPEPEEPTDFLDLTVSVKNSQTGALIGGSEIGIRKYGDTGFYYNTTLPSGYTTVFLPAGNYEIFAEAPGYYQVYPARITLDEPHENIGVFLQPITPIPEEGNVTLNLWVCYVEHGSGQAVGIPYADILISGISGDGIGYSSGSLITDMGGYLTLDIPANTEYIAYAEKPGYLAGTTHFTVYNVSPVNMTIQMIREIPPTVPVVTPSPTIPTLPTPTEPLGFMEQSGKALADLFGVSLSIGKMMLGVLISLAVGMGTAKNLKGGAPEFCVGFLGAAFLVTMADLIPVGFFVAMLLLMGIYIARAYFLGGENGG